MAHPHSHGVPAPLSPFAARVVVAALAVIGLAVVIGAVLLWPSGTKADIPLPFQNTQGGSVTTERGQVASTALADAGFLVPPIRFPTVPRGTARLRVSLSAAHPAEAVNALRSAIDAM